MSRETDEWLNNQTLIGFTDKRGTAWHYRSELQGDEPNHYPGAIPLDDVERRLFNWDPLEVPMQGIIRAKDSPDGESHVIKVPRKAIIHSKTFAYLGDNGRNYQPHEYREWLLRNIGTILDDELSIGSAGLLSGGAQAWVSVEVPENMSVEGVEFRVNLNGITSLDGTFKTTYNRTAQFIVCDNTMNAALRESHGSGLQVAIKHSSRSLEKIGDVREALGIVYQTADDFSKEIERLTAIDVSDRMFRRFVDFVKPIPLEKGIGQTKALKYAYDMQNLWTKDERVAPWRNTAWGVLAAQNTWQHHNREVRGASRADRNMFNALSGRTAEADRQTLATLEAVLAG